MSHYLVYGLGGALIFSIGVYGMLARPHLLHKVVAANLMGSGVFLMLIGLGNRAEGRPDPVPQAMVLTGIVVTVALTALGLAIVKRYYTVTGLTTLDDDPPEADA
ncbi:MAG TPA: Na+/H+ antiporter subunit C [Coriobacteriia bacterium]|jgi:multicomponent Na+:H+ antiporter subunit C|nr:MAG: NADH-ubiquinone oxidoreductase chain 4L [Actinobacteria bacterium 66_15]HAL29952.1 Na+/H+ antiporter subunit C [Coriobacteriia bacterium]